MLVHASSRVVGVRVRTGRCVEALGSAHRSSPPIPHAIRSSDQFAMSRKPRNFNDVNSKFERGVGELHAKLRWGSGAPSGLGVPGVWGPRGFGVPGVSGCQGFRGASGSCRNRSYKPTARDAPPGFRVVELCAARDTGIE